LEGSDFLKSFYQYDPKFENLFKAIEERKKFPVQRNILVDVLLEQNKDFLNANGLADKIHLLKSENTFTITTGHQLGIAGGPLFFIYKIITAIKFAKQLNHQCANEKFVPVFWMASEDHDFAEIASVNVFNNKLTWNNPAVAGACGELSTNSLNELIEALKKINGDTANAIDLNRILSDCYQTGLTLAEATRKFVYAILGEYGVVVIDANDTRLKKAFTTFMRDELLNHTAHQKVGESSERLAQKYKPQVFPREVNLFFKDNNLRERIVALEDGTYSVNNTDLFFPKDVFFEMLDKHPERFSPNVIMRPLYQETILPNIAYVGGAGELA
jgi:bacillithiol biosynthesis cysteine-adding enzyme BshC